MHIFESKEDLERGGDAQYHIEVSYVEIYNEEIRDELYKNRSSRKTDSQ